MCYLISHIFLDQNALDLPWILAQWLYPALSSILNLSLFTDTFHSVCIHAQFSAYPKNILKFLPLVNFLMILLLEDLKFIIFIHYSHFLNMCYLLGVCNSVSMLCKIISDAFPVKLNDLFLVTSLWVLIFVIIISFLNLLHILFPWLYTLLSLFLFISFFLPYNCKKKSLQFGSWISSTLDPVPRCTKE